MGSSSSPKTTLWGRLSTIWLLDSHFSGRAASMAVGLAGEAAGEKFGDDAGAILDADFDHDEVDERFHGAGAGVHPLGDLLVTEAGGDSPDRLLFARGQVHAADDMLDGVADGGIALNVKGDHWIE